MEKTNIKTKSQIWRKIQKPKIERLNQYLDEKTIIEHTVWDNSRERLLLIPQLGDTINICAEKMIDSFLKK